VIPNIGVEAFLILHDLLDHLVIAIHVYEQEKLLEVSDGRGCDNHDRQRLPDQRLNTFDTRRSRRVRG
jgi:hypothetical protein